MSWFDRQICTVDEAQTKSGASVPGFLQIGDSAKLWVEDLQRGAHRSIACYVVGVKATFGKLYYDIAVPLGDSGLCAVSHDICDYVTPPHVQSMPAPGVDVTNHLPELRRELMHSVRSEQDHAAQAAVAEPKPEQPRAASRLTVVSIPNTGKYFTKAPVE